jgi:hypothetical protein
MKLLTIIILLVTHLVLPMKANQEQSLQTSLCEKFYPVDKILKNYSKDAFSQKNTNMAKCIEFINKGLRMVEHHPLNDKRSMKGFSKLFWKRSRNYRNFQKHFDQN